MCVSAADPICLRYLLTLYVSVAEPICLRLAMIERKASIAQGVAHRDMKMENCIIHITQNRRNVGIAVKGLIMIVCEGHAVLVCNLCGGLRVSC